MKITVEMIMKQKPCDKYTVERMEQIAEGRNSMTLMEISHLDIPSEDRIWVITRFLDDRSNRLFAADCAERCVDKIKNPEMKTRTINLLQRVRDCANGLITVDELAAYRTACWAADRAAYWAADEAASGAADWAADRAAYGAAYWAADRAADMAADEAAEQEWMIERLRRYIREVER